MTSAYFQMSGTTVVQTKTICVHNFRSIFIIVTEKCYNELYGSIDGGVITTLLKTKFQQERI